MPTSNHVIVGVSEQALRRYWEDDFTPLQAAGKSILSALRQDESAPDADLYRRIASGSSTRPSSSTSSSSSLDVPGHRYFGMDETTTTTTGSSAAASTIGTPTSGSIRGVGIGGGGGKNSKGTPFLNMRHERSVPLPSYLAQQLKTTKVSTYMGLFPEADLAWMTVDDSLYLWSYTRTRSNVAGPSTALTLVNNNQQHLYPNNDGTMEDFLSFEVPGHRPIVSVGLVPPKPGVFKDSVEWCLIVTTPEEAILCALARAPATLGSSSSSPLRLVPTRFVIPSDWVAFLSVAGTSDGRVFLGGQDGKLYEMDYDEVVALQQIDNPPPNQLHRELEEFYDGSKPCPPVLTEKLGTGVTSVSVKRAISSVVFGSTSSTASWAGPRKCRKLNHSSSSIVSAFVPDFIRDATSAVFGVGGTHTGGGPIVQMVVDNERQVLYTLSSRGWISAVDISAPLTKRTDGTPTVRLAGVMDSVNTARQYLEAVSRGRMYPPTSSSGSSTTGIITFPGGGASAQAGVGGMDGARTILKLADATSDSRRNYQQQRRRGGGGRQNDHLNNILAPVALHVVPRRESARLTLVAVTAGGLRYYISSLAPSVLSNGPSNHFGTNRLTDPLTPYSKLTFCHIRAPPPLSNISASGGINTGTSHGSGEGMVPQMAATLTQLSRVDASWYRLGVFVVALKKTSSSGNSSSNGHADMGNVIVTACVDSVARVKEAMNPTGTASTTTGAAMDKLVAPGGICEVLSLPMSNASGSSFSFMGSQGNGSLTSDLPVLHGGRVWEMSVNLGAESTILSLALQSKTPTDPELSVGMVPAYFPKSKIQSSSPFDGGKPSPQQLTSGSDGNNNGSTGSSRSTSAMAITLLQNMVLGRPLRQGIDVQRPRLEGGPASNLQGGSQISTYRVSKRDGTGGFSLSAGDEKTGRPKASPSLSSSAPSSATRLSPWLLRPAVVPLNPLSIQHLMLPSRQMIALNAGGLHYFGIRTVLMSLADTILSSGVNVDNDPNVTEFFKSYGYKEGCAMCLLLAIGYGGNNSEDLKDRATRAALRRALQPKLLPLPPDASNGGAAVPQSSDWNGMNDSDPLIPAGYKFEPSALCEALSLVLARLLRPIWHKPAVVVTEGPTVIRRMGSSTSRRQTTPAKVELLLDEVTLEGVRHPLYSLLLLIRQVFSRAVNTIPGNAKINGDGGIESMEVDDNNDAAQEAHFVTRALEYNQHARAGTGGTYQLRPAEAEEMAYLTEERIIHSFYRLLSRTIQLMSLLSHLRRAQSMPDLPEVEWGLLHGLTIAQLVLTRDGHERMESVLNSLIALSTDSAAAKVTGFPPSAEASQLANVLTEQCYHFFSPGSRFAYLGFRSSTDALACPPGTSRRKTRQDEAVKFLRRAARHWNSPPLITGRILRTKERERYEDMASRAHQFDSPLAKAVSLLIELEEVSGVVEICLLTAANFVSKKHGNMVEASDLMHPEYTSKDLLPWEKGLYHKRRNGTLINGTSDRSSGTSAVGTTVTAKDALDTCYALIFSNVTKLLNLPDKFLGKQMVSVCAASTDKEFLQALFSHLLESNHADTLLLIDNPDLEKWLMQSSSNPDLLYKYYVTQRKYVEAGEDAWKRARQTSEEVSIDVRITWLVRANDCYSMALEKFTPSGSTHGVGWEQWGSPGAALVVDVNELNLTQTHVAESLGVAKLQSRILNTVNSSQFSLPEEDRKKLEFSLVDVSDLYNSYALPMNMNESCLLVLHVCRHNNEDYIRSHWKCIVCEEILPCSTRSERVYNFLRNLTVEVGSEQNFVVTLLSDTATADASQPLFESGVWMKKLESRLVSLGKELYGTGADYMFPLSFIVSLLEELQRVYTSVVTKDVARESHGWPFHLLVRVGVPYLLSLEAYERIIESEDRSRMGGDDASRRLEHLTNIVVMLESWITDARSVIHGSRNVAMDQLAKALATGVLLSKIEEFKTQVQALPLSASDVERRLGAIEVAVTHMR